MLRNHRVWLAGLALAAAAFAAQANAADTKYLPDDTEIIFNINFKQILDSDLVKAQKDIIAQAKQQIENNMPGEAEKYLKMIGFDVFRDLGSITIAAPAKKDPDAGFIIIEGIFHPKKFYEAAAQAAKDHGDHLKITEIGKQKVLEIQAPGEKTAYVAMINKTTILACSQKERLTKALARAAEGGKATLKKNVKDLMQTINSKQSISGLATGEALAKHLEDAPIPNAQAIGPALQAIEGLSGAVTIGKDIQFQLGVGTKDGETAKDFAQKANFGLILAKGLLAQEAKKDMKLLPLVDVLNTLRAEAKGSSLVLRAEVSVENIEKLIKNFNPNN
jgi:hypothetical protein